MTTFSIRMRSSAEGQHISGAERLTSAADLPSLAAAMARRALHHDKGTADTIHITVDTVDESAIATVDALSPKLETNDNPTHARTLIAELLMNAGASAHAAHTAVELAYTLTGLRGAALIDSQTGRRLDIAPSLPRESSSRSAGEAGGIADTRHNSGRSPRDSSRGVRVSTFDATRHPDQDCAKNHFHEAIILASKVHSAAGIVAEICISDDPYYTRGYVATRGVFHRIPNMKNYGSELGTRIFLVEPGTDIDSLTDYLENAPVYVNLTDVNLDNADANAISQLSCPSAEGPTPLETTANAASFRTIEEPVSLDSVASARNAEWERSGLSRTLRTFSTAQLPHSRIDGADYLLFSSSDYLGLSTHTEPVKAACHAIATFGTGAGGSRLTTGTSIHSALERELAAFFGYADAVVFATGYQANHSTIAAIGSEDVEIFSDSANHASIIDGCRAARGSVTVFPHADYAALDRLLSSSVSRHKLVISDAVFSMSGEIIDVCALNHVCETNGAWLMLDDAHGVSVVGDHGRGTASYFGVTPDIVVGTASKALGVEGGFVLCSRQVGTLLRNQARSFVYSTAMNPGSVSAIRAALGQLKVGDVVTQLQANIAAIQALLGQSCKPASAIFALPVGGEDAAMAVSAQLAKYGIFIPAIRYPTVPRGEAMLRLTVTARHSAADITSLGKALRRVGLV